MQLETARFLDLVERTNSLIFFDSESQGFQGDYGAIHVVSCKPFGKPPRSFSVQQLGNDKKVVREAKEYLESAMAWCGFYSKGHDIRLLNTRLLRWGLAPIEPRPHLDLYFALKYKLATGRKSQAHLLEFLEETMAGLGIKPEKKMSVSPNVWTNVGFNFAANMKTLIQRCESDVTSLEALYRTTKTMVRDITR